MSKLLTFGKALEVILRLSRFQEWLDGKLFIR